MVCSAVVAVLMQDPEEVLTRAGFYTMGFEGSSLGGRAGGGERDGHSQAATNTSDAEKHKKLQL